MPVMLMLCGPNGAGKSTARQTLGLDFPTPVIDPDRLAREGGLSPVEAGKEAARLARQYIAERTDFARESTMTAKFDSGLVDLAKSHGFTVELFYLGLDSPEFAIARVAERVANGGHDVPPEDVERRYIRGLKNLGQMLAKVDHGRVFSNAGEKYQLILEVQKGRASVKEGADLPSWLTKALGVSPSLLKDCEPERLNKLLSRSIEKCNENDLSL